MKILLDGSKNFYKANLHCHTTLSDGALTPEQVKSEYKSRGYSIVAFTDHEHLIDHSDLNDDDFLVLTACEIAIKQFENESTMKNLSLKVCHLNLYSLDAHNVTTPCYSKVYDHFVNDENRDLVRYDGDGEYKREYGACGINRIIAEANDKGFIVSYNHPSWSLENACDYVDYDGLFAVEIFNTSCVMMGHKVDENVFDDFLRAGKRIYCTATDDNHNKNGVEEPYGDSFGGRVYVNAQRLEYSEIMNALKNGDFYASSGPEINSLVLDGDCVRIKCSPVDRISLITRGRNVKTLHSLVETGKRGALTDAELKLDPNEKYFRVRIESTDGRAAYTQAYEI